MQGKPMLKEHFKVKSKHTAFYTGGNVEWLSDGSKLFCQNGSTVNVLNVAGGQITTKLHQAAKGEVEDPVLTFTLNSIGQSVVTAHKSGLFKLWNWKNGKMQKTWRSMHKGPVSRLTLRGWILASGGSDSGVRIWDIKAKSCNCSMLGLSGVVSVLEFRPEVEGIENTIFGAADDTTICSWNVESGQKLATLSGHYSRIMAIVFARDGVHMVSAGRDRVLIMWDLNKNVSVRVLPAYESIEGLVLLPPRFRLPGIAEEIDTGVSVATAGSNGVIRVWDMLSSKELYVQQNSLIPKSENNMQAIVKLLFSEETATFSVVSFDHNIFMYQLDTFECLKQLVGFSDEILDLALLGKDESHLAVASNSKDIKVYAIKNMSCQLLQGHTDLVLGLSVTPADPNVLVSCSKDHSLRIWQVDTDTGTGSCVGVATGHTGSVGAVAFARLSSKKFASVSEDSCIKLWKWDAANGARLLETKIAHTMPINAIAFSCNDKMIATGSQDKTAKLWTAASLTPRGTVHGHTRGVWSVAFGQFEQLLLTASADTTVRIWSLKDLSCQKTLQGHEGSVLRAVFMSRGQQVMSAGGDGIIKLWTIGFSATECTQTLGAHEGRVWALTVTRDDMAAFSGGTDSRLIRWKDATEEMKKEKIKEIQWLDEQEQLLANLIQQDQLLAALRLAIELDRPARSLAIIRQVLKSDDEGKLREITSSLSTILKQKLLDFTTVWNTNSRNCHVAQVILSVLMDDLTLGTLPVVARTVEDALPYTDRHLKRLTRLLQDVHLLAYTAVLSRPDLTPLDAPMDTTTEAEAADLPEEDLWEDLAILDRPDLAKSTEIQAKNAIEASKEPMRHKHQKRLQKEQNEAEGKGKERGKKTWTLGRLKTKIIITNGKKKWRKRPRKKS